MEEKKKLFILDSYSLIHQSYYAVKNELTNPDGVPVKAVFAFLKTLHRIIEEEKPGYVVAAFDHKDPSFRKEMFPQYKANRKAMPEDLVPQIDIIRDFLEAYGIEIVEKPGFEADDVIGTLAHRAKKEGYEVYMVSRDKDLKQLLDSAVRLYNNKDMQSYGPEDLKKDCGLEPAQFIDFLALTGDTSDNIPGVPGVGPKTALNLLGEWGDLNGTLENADKVKGKLGERLRSNRDEARLSRKLVTIECDVPLEVSFENFRLDVFDPERLAPLYRKHGFKSFLENLDIELETADKAEYACINTPDLFEDFLAQFEDADVFAFDSEATSTDPHTAEIVGISFSRKKGAGYYLPFRAGGNSETLDRDETLKKLKTLFLDSKRTMTGHNLKYDLVLLRRYGVAPKNRLFDTMIAAHLVAPAELGGASLSLDSLARELLGYKTVTYKEVAGKGSDELTLDLVSLDEVTRYASEDADIAFRLREYLLPRMKKDEVLDLFDNIEMPLLEVLVTMETNGVGLDGSVLEELSLEISSRLETLIKEIYDTAGEEFNIDSPKQLSHVLFDKLKLPVIRKTKTGYSTDHRVLETLASRHEMPKKILEYRSLAKLKNTYVDVLPDLVNPETGRLHTSFNQAVTATGRLSSSNPNLQNIPIRTEMGRKIRGTFVPAEKGRLIMTSDYSQVELRVLAHFSGDENLKKAFEEDVDIHTRVASQLFDVAEGLVASDQRAVAKAVNFGIIYGQTAFGLSNALNISRGEAQQFIDEYFAMYPGVRGFIDQVVENAEKDGHVCTLSGRRRNIAEINSPNKSRKAFAERTAVNTVVQGTAADLIKIAMINIHRRLLKGDSTARLVLQIHDELVFEVEENTVDRDRELVEQEMTGAMKLDVPIKVSVAVAPNWLEAK